MACLNHESAIKTFPTGGWACFFLGHPDRGVGVKQPGGWIYNILPYVEQESLYKGQAGKTGTDLQAAATELVQTPLALLHCPSRRGVGLFPNLATKVPPADQALYTSLGQTGDAEIIYDASSTTVQRITSLKLVARNDYAGNGYSWVSLPAIAPSCPPLAAGLGAALTAGPAAADAILDDSAKLEVGRGAIAATDGGKGGIFFPLSTVATRDVSDGVSNTYLVGEKFMDPDHYADGQLHGDQWNAFIGDDPDITRYAFIPTFAGAAQDNSTRGETGVFGSAHPGVMNMAFCDGSVHQIEYGISTEIHASLSNRADGTTVDMSQLNL